MEARLERSVYVDVEGPEGVRVATGNENNKDMEKLTLGIPRCVQGLSRDGAGLEHDRGSWGGAGESVTWWARCSGGAGRRDIPGVA